MRILLLFLLLFGLSGCSYLDDFKEAQQTQKESYIDEQAKNNNATFKFYCVVYTKPVAEFIISTSLNDDVSCPTDLKPFNEDYTDLIQTVFYNFNVTLFLIIIYVIFRISFVTNIQASSKGKAKGIESIIYKAIIAIIFAPHPANGISVAWILFGIISFSGLNLANTQLTYYSDKNDIGQNVSIQAPNKYFKTSEFLNQIEFYEVAIANNKTASSNLNFTVIGDKVLTESTFGKAVFRSSILLNKVGYEISDKFGFAYGKDYQVSQIREFLTESHAKSRFHAEKILNYKTNVYANIETEDFSKISCSDLDSYSLNRGVSLKVVQLYRYRAAACQSESMSNFFNNLDVEFKHANANVDLCNVSALDSSNAKSCVAESSTKSLYALSVALEFYNFVKSSESQVKEQVFQLANQMNRQKRPTLTENGKVFYNSYSVELYTDVKKETYKNTYPASAFSIPVSTTYNPNQRSASFLAELHSSIEVEDSSSLSSASVKKLISNFLSFGEDGIFGYRRYEYCMVHAKENTEQFRCLSRSEEKNIYGTKMLLTGATIKSLAFLNKGNASRSRSAEAMVSNAVRNAPSRLMGVIKTGAQVGGIVALDAATADAWQSSEMDFQTSEAFYILAASIALNGRLQEEVQSVGTSLMTLGFFIAYGQEIAIYMFITATVVVLLIGMLGFILKIMMMMAKDLYNKQTDETLDISEAFKEMILFFMKPSIIVASFFIAAFCYDIAMFNLYDSTFSDVYIMSDDISFTNYINLLWSEGVTIFMGIVFAWITFGKIDQIVSFITKLFASESTVELVNAEEAKAKLDTSKGALKKSSYKNQAN